MSQYRVELKPAARRALKKLDRPVQRRIGSAPEATDDEEEDKPKHSVDWTPLVEAGAPILSKLGELAAMKAISFATTPKPTVTIPKPTVTIPST